MLLVSPVAYSAWAAVGGSLVGALASVVSSWVLQTGATRREFLSRSIQARQRLYARYIRTAAALYSNAMSTSDGDLTKIIELYAVISRIRLVASQPVVSAAVDVVTVILHRYNQPNVTVADFQTTSVARTADPLAAFSHACRQELEKVMILGS